MNAENILNASVLSLINQTFGEDWKDSYSWSQEWDPGEAQSWLIKIAGGAVLDVRLLNSKIFPVLV